MFEPSKYQKAVYTYILKGKGNAVVDAVAGSGKSTTIVNALKIIPQNKKILFLAFNKSIVEELKRKVGNLPNVEISTLHSLGARACRKACRCSINSSKYTAKLTQWIDDETIQSPAWQNFSKVEKLNWKQNIRKLVDLMRVNLIENKKDATELSYKHDIDLLDNEIEVALKLIEWGKNRVNEIDFTDMIYFPNIMKIELPQFDWVFIDECQDLNSAQRGMFLKCVKPNGGRWIAVGDERQAIYGFAGADAESFKKLRNLPHTIKLPLSICYRCDKSIIELAQSIVPQIQARSTADEGIIDKNASVKDVKDGDMILCRITAPLIKLCMKYISSEIKAYVKGRDIGENLCRLIEQTKEKNIEAALDKIRCELGKIVGRLIAQHIVSNEEEAKQHPRYVMLNDKIESIENISVGLTKSSEVINKIKTMFSDENGEGICLSTIHKSKGLENDRVFILCEDKMPLKCCVNIPWMCEQEYNLIYVAETRAKHYLGYIQDFK